MGASSSETNKGRQTEMNRNKVINGAVQKLVMLAIALVVGFSSLALTAQPAEAHGEKSQQAFLRMRTLHWYDVTWSKTKVAVNDEVEIKGTVRFFRDWPDSVAKPDVGFLNIGVPGPTFVRLSSYLNGVNMVNSTSFVLGRDYDWKVLLKARRPGRYHVHTLMNIQEAGPLIGPGNWMEITGDMNDFTYPVTTLTGETVDLERFGIANVVKWHIIWAVPALIWLVYWLLKAPLLLPRFRMVIEKGDNADSMVTSRDVQMGVVMLVVTLGLTTFGYFYARGAYPRTVPLQTGQVAVEPNPIPQELVTVVFQKARYRIPGREMAMTISVTNSTDSAVRVGEFTSANVRWFNQEVAQAPADYPEDIVAKTGIVIDKPSPIEPGETRSIIISAADPMWETWRLSKLIYDPDSRFGGLIFFYDANGNRHISEIGGPMLPTFQKEAL
jgi:methane/ammonia monooxygenase subunit B